MSLNFAKGRRSLLSVIMPCAVVLLWATATVAQSPSSPVIVQPGAPGEPTKVLPATTRPVLREPSKKDIEFMQGMIHHHAQAVEMVALMDERTENKELRLLGARISHSQAEEMGFMRRWLAVRGLPTEMSMSGLPGMDHSHHDGSHQMLMPGMLTPGQMKALKESSGREFDLLFLEGMIQHHGGALTMVKELFNAPGAAQDADMFNFVTDVDSGQRAEIRIMQEMLGKLPRK